MNPERRRPRSAPARALLAIVCLTPAVVLGSQGATSATTPTPIRVNTTVGQADGGRTDIVRVRLSGAGAEGALTTLYRRAGERDVRLGSRALDEAGMTEFRVRDRNGRRYTQYFVVVSPTESSLGRRGPVKRVR